MHSTDAGAALGSATEAPQEVQAMTSVDPGSDMAIIVVSIWG